VTTFKGMIGHQAVRDLLEAELENPSHAYLFVGPSNVGKATAARLFGAELVGAGDADAVRRAVAGSHPDLVLVAPEGRTSITVDQARAIVAASVLSPLEAESKVFLLEEASMLNDEAANALLKTIEEPIRSSSFILVADSEFDLPATIASRCRTIVFGRVSEADISEGLQEQGIDPVRAGEAARISGGRPGLALALASEPAVAAFRDEWLAVPAAITDHPGDAYRTASKVLAATEPLLAAVKVRQEAEIEQNHPDGNIPKAVQDRQHRELARASDALYVTGLELLASFYRDIAASQMGAEVQNTDMPVALLTRMDAKAAVVNADRIFGAIDALHANQRPNLALAALFVDLGSDA
jgi:DNA polymerase-3 subunit delta'